MPCVYVVVILMLGDSFYLDVHFQPMIQQLKMNDNILTNYNQYYYNLQPMIQQLKKK